MTMPLTAPRRPIPLLFVLAAVSLLALNGLGLALTALGDAGSEANQHEASAVGHPVETSFGIVTVEALETLPGLTSQELGGVTHGIQNLVLSDSAQIEVSVAIVNGPDGMVAIDPAQFRLRVAGTTEPVLPTGASIHPLRLKPDARVEATLTFVVPRTGNAIAVDYVDPASGQPLTVAEGTVDQAPADAAGEHAH